MIKYILALLLLLPTLSWAGPEMLMMLTNGSGTVGSGGGTISDNFSTDTAANYTSITGGITVGSGVASGTAWTNNKLYQNVTSLGSANQDVSAVVNYNGTSEGGGVLARVDTGSSPVTGYMAYFSSAGMISIYKFGSSSVNLGNYNGSYSSGTYTIRFTVNGTTLKAYVDGVERVSITDSSYSSGNYCGIQIKRDVSNYTATVDDLSASAL